MIGIATADDAATDRGNDGKAKSGINRSQNSSHPIIIDTDAEREAQSGERDNRAHHEPDAQRRPTKRGNDDGLEYREEIKDQDSDSDRQELERGQKRNRVGRRDDPEYEGGDSLTARHQYPPALSPGE